jgi:cation transport ATPase
VFVYGGRPFLIGAVREVRDRAPGMMLLISMAITVAYVASLVTLFGAFDLDFRGTAGRQGARRRRPPAARPDGGDGR